MKNKKIIFQVTKTYMKKNKKRTIITFAGILVMVVLMTAVFVGKDTVMDFMRRAVEADQGKWHYQVYDVAKEEADEISALKSIDKLEISRPLGYTDFPQSANIETPYLELKGYSGELFDWMNINIIEGRVPETEEEILISERAIEDGADIKVGDTVDVDAFDRYVHAYFKEGEEEKIAAGKAPGVLMFGNNVFSVEHGTTVKAPAHFAYWPENDDFEEIHEPTGLKGTYTIVGIMETPSYESDGQGGYTAITKNDSDIADGETINLVFTIDLKSNEKTEGEIASIIDSHRNEEERAEVKENGSAYMLEDGTRIPVVNGQIVSNDLLLVFAAKGTDANFNMLMIFFQAFFIILISAASLVLIYNVFSMSYKERSRYLGMLSSVGATRRQKKWSVYYEVFVLLAMALPIGIILGLLVVKGAMMLLYPHFAKIISSIATNVITGKSCEIDYHLIINPLNIFFVLIFSAAAVWISAWIPAIKISKVGPIESIRGNDDTGVRIKKHGFKTHFALMMKGRPERLLSAASISRNRHSTQGIIRSITVFISLTLITAFAVRSFTDIVKSKADQEDVAIGSKYEGYEYSFSFDDDAQYMAGKEDIVTSDEVSDYIEMNIELAPYNIALSDYSEEYRDDLNRILDLYYPGEKPQIVVDNFLEPVEIWSNPEVNMITLSDEQFSEVAKKAGVDVSGENPVLVYEKLILSTEEYEFAFEGALQPDFTSYEVKNPFNYKVGDEINLMYGEYIKDKDEIKEIDIPVTFAGYIDASDIEEYYSLKGRAAWIITSETTREYIRSLTPEDASGMGIRQVLFNVNTNDSKLVRNLSQLKDEFDNKAIRSASIATGLTDFRTAITKIINIVAVCFTLLIALICMLNLYNSVMGRRLSRHQEISVLKSMGMTKKQKNKMLLLENIRLMVKSLIYSGLITGAFVVAIRFILNSRFGKISFTLPVWMMLIIVLTSVISLLFFTSICYKDDNNITLVQSLYKE
ncbi:MAG: ABC transporter permease [Eubacterium sp.]|nr:ABC transporter permease [Eubacterium sp.]